MLAMVGGFLGWKLVLLTILIGSLLGSIWGLAGVALSRYGMKQALPFGTFLAIGAFLALTAGPLALQWYGLVSGLGGVGRGSGTSGATRGRSRPSFRFWSSFWRWL